MAWNRQIENPVQEVSINEREKNELPFSEEVERLRGTFQMDRVDTSGEFGEELINLKNRFLEEEACRVIGGRYGFGPAQISLLAEKLQKEKKPTIH